MSADNGIYIGVFKDGERRVIEAQAIENIDYPESENASAIVDYFGNAKVFHTTGEALEEACRMETEIANSDFPILEYGISTILFSKSFSAYVHEAEEQKKFNEEQS